MNIRNKLIYANVIHIPYRAFRYDVSTPDMLGLGQTLNFSWHEPNSNLGGPKARLFVGSDVELRTRRTNQLNQTKKQFFKKFFPEWG